MHGFIENPPQQNNLYSILTAEKQVFTQKNPDI